MINFYVVLCLYIENMKIRPTNKAKKIDKEALVKNIYHNLFNIAPDGEEMAKVLADVQFLINHNKIKKISWYRKRFFL